MQLCHAGRKGATQLGWENTDRPLEDEAKNWPIYSASPIPYFEGVSQVPAELDRVTMDRIREDFVQATERAERAGFDMVELRCAHGYLLASFLSPLTNTRHDEYGGAIENRLRCPLEVRGDARCGRRKSRCRCAFPRPTGKRGESTRPTASRSQRSLPRRAAT
ncbi:oxidoreductase [Aurantimonas marina]|uniref:oxidoreductase n=1 Tax=Aurantimonas marina TaxID=2780508 RepID=UPI001E307B76|nr:hypothetical protein [Aurantimonas marina]